MASDLATAMKSDDLETLISALTETDAWIQAGRHRVVELACAQRASAEASGDARELRQTAAALERAWEAIGVDAPTNMNTAHSSVVASSQEVVRGIFESAFKDSGGTVDVVRLEQLFQTLCPSLWPDDQLIALLDSAGVVRNGHVEINEFLDVLFAEPVDHLSEANLCGGAASSDANASAASSVVRSHGMPPARIVVACFVDGVVGIRIAEELDRIRADIAPFLSHVCCARTADVSERAARDSAPDQAFVSDAAGRLPSLRARGSFLRQVAAEIRAALTNRWPVLVAIISTTASPRVEEAELRGVVQTCAAERQAAVPGCQPDVEIMTFAALEDLKPFIEAERRLHDIVSEGAANGDPGLGRCLAQAAAGSPEPLAAELAARSYTDRAAAARLLGVLAATRAWAADVCANVLEQLLLRDSWPLVRATAARSLGGLGTASPHAFAAASALGRTLHEDTDALVRWAAASALANLGAAAAAAGARAALEDAAVRDSSHEVREAALSTLTLFEAIPTIEDKVATV